MLPMQEVDGGLGKAAGVLGDSINAVLISHVPTNMWKQFG